MYIRPQLRRKRTENREILSQEHISDVSLYEKTLDEGTQFSSDSNKDIKVPDGLVGLFEKEACDKIEKKGLTCKVKYVR